MILKKLLLLFLFFSISTISYPQDKPNTKYWIYFKDKGEFNEKTKIAPGTKSYETGKALLTDRAVKKNESFNGGKVN